MIFEICLVVVGIVVGIAALLIGSGLILFLILYIKKRKKVKRNIVSSHKESDENVSDKESDVQHEEPLTPKSNKRDSTNYLSIPSMRLTQQQILHHEQSQKTPKEQSGTLFISLLSKRFID
jgi:hypothetical protein